MNVYSWNAYEIANLGWAVPLSAGMVALVSPWGRRFAWTLGAIDEPDTRKVHRRATPRLGGLAAAMAMLTCVALWLIIEPTAMRQCSRCWGLLPGVLMMFLIGLSDDLVPRRPQTKLVAQFLAAALICFGGVRIDGIELPGIGSLDLGAAGPLITMFWIVGVTNALNFLDGLDGLAAGTAALAASSFLLLAGGVGRGSMLGLLGTALIGACGILVINNVRSPKCFLGDSGSLLLGVIVASMAILSARNGQTGRTRIGLGVIVLAVPLIDMTACVVRRAMVGRSIFSADRGHIHHMLLSFGLSPNAVAAILCGATAMFGLAAAAAGRGPAWIEGLILFVLAAGSIVLYRRFGYLSLRMWLHCRRANRILADLTERIRAAVQVEASRPSSETPPADRVKTVVDGIRRAKRTLGIEYIRVQRDGISGQLRPPVLELGREPAQVVTTRLYAANRSSSTEELTVTLGEGPSRRPARIHAKELLIMPLLIELADALSPRLQRSATCQSSPTSP